MDYEDKKERWHVGKEIPLVVIAGFVVQIFIAGTFVERINSRIDATIVSIAANTGDIIANRTSVYEIGKRANSHDITLAEINVTLKTLLIAMERLADLRGDRTP